MDSLVADLFDHIQGEHARTGYLSEMPAVARALGLDYALGQVSVALPQAVRVSRLGTPEQQRADAAHEISHALADEGGYTAAIRHHHVSAPDLDAHLEELAEHGADLLLMPNSLVVEILRQRGFCGAAVWELSRFAGVSVSQALRRLVYFREQRCAGFIVQNSYVQDAYTQNHYLPFWIGDRVPEIHLALREGVSLFSVPGKRGRVIGFLTFDH